MLLITQFYSAYGFNYKEYYAKEKIMNRSALHKITLWRTYSQKIDVLVSQLKDDEKKLQKVEEKVNVIISNLENKNTLSSKEKQTLAILKYLSASIVYEKEILKEEKLENINTKVENTLQEIKNSQISQQDAQKVEEIFTDMQASLVANLQDTYESLYAQLEKETNYSAQGDLQFDMDFSHKDFGELTADFDIKDYVINNSVFDAQISAQINALVQSIWKDSEEMKVQFSSFVDYIQKNWGIYVLLKDLEITTSEENEMIQEFIQTAKEAAEDNAYLDISDPQTQQVYEILNALNSEKIFADMHTYSQKSLFTSYKKVGNTHYIIPTKYACDTAKQISAVFDPFSGNTCSESQYESLLEWYLGVWEITLTIDSNNYTLSLEPYDFDNIEDFDFNIVFTSDEITGVNFKIVPDQTLYENDVVSLQYEKNNFINADIVVSELQLQAHLEAKLDSSNKVKKLEYTQNFQSEYFQVDSNLTFQDKKFNWNATLQSLSYMWETTEIDEKIVFNIQWTTDYYNSIETFWADFLYNDYWVDVAQWNLIINFPQVVFNLEVIDPITNTEFIIDLDSKFDNQDNYFYDLEFNSHFITQETQFDYDTWEQIKIWEPKKLFDANYELQNGRINWDVIIKGFDDEELITINTKGTYFGKQWDIKNIIEFNESLNFLNQVPKARDSARISDMNALRAAIEQSYQDNYEYPSYENFNEAVSSYLLNIPKDPYAGKIIDGCEFWYKYSVWDDINGIKNQIYKISTCLESTWSYANMLEQDNGNDNTRYESGVSSDTLDGGIYINNISSWEEQSQEIYNGNPVVNYDVIFDYTNDKTNVEVFLKLFLGDTQISEIYMKNRWNIKYAPVEITAPKNTIKLDNHSDNYYYEGYYYENDSEYPDFSDL